MVAGGLDRAEAVEGLEEGEEEDEEDTTTALVKKKKKKDIKRGTPVSFSCHSLTPGITSSL